MHEMHSVQAVVEMGTGMLIQASDVQYVKFEGSAPADWSISSAFHDTGALKPQQKEQFTLLLDSAEMGGIALSVEGDDDEDQINGHSEDDRASHADELAISMVLEGPRQFALIGA
jgi:allantoicase